MGGGRNLRTSTVVTLETLPAWARDLLAEARVARLGYVDEGDHPRVLPVTFAVAGGAVWSAIDDKPKRSAEPARLRHLRRRPHAALLVDRYDEDWTRLGWVLLHGRAEILADGVEHDAAQVLLRARYPQLAQMRIAHRAVIVIRITRSVSWGDLSIKA